MKSKALKITLIGLLAVAAALTVILLILSRKPSLKDKIINTCKENDETTVSLSDYTDFEWDRCIIYNTKARSKDIRSFGIDYKDELDLNDGIVFANGGEVVYEERFNSIKYQSSDKIAPFVIYPYSENSEEQIGAAEFSKEQSKFKCIKYNSEKGTYYRLYPDI